MRPDPLEACRAYGAPQGALYILCPSSQNSLKNALLDSGNAIYPRLVSFSFSWTDVIWNKI